MRSKPGSSIPPWTLHQLLPKGPCPEKLKYLYKCILLLFSFFIRYFLHLHFTCYPESPLYPPPALLPKPPTPLSWPWHSPVLGHIIFARPRASPSIDGRLGHLLLHMQLETQLWVGGGGWLLVSSYCCSSYRVADPFIFLVTFSSSFIRGPCDPSNRWLWASTSVFARLVRGKGWLVALSHVLLLWRNIRNTAAYKVKHLMGPCVEF